MSEYRRRCASIAVTLLIINLLVSAIPEVVSTVDDWTSPHRKLLHSEGAALEQIKRVWGDTCSTADLVINQAQTAPLPSGIPSYTVEITNVCATGCDIAGIHLNCVWFSSARLINPRIFKRLKYNDCLVNDGKPLGNGRTISFQYYNTFQYPLSVQRVNC